MSATAVWAAVMMCLTFATAASAEGYWELGKKVMSAEEEEDSVSYGDKKYGWVTVGNRKWMTKNLEYKPTWTGAKSLCPGNTDANCATYGRLYDWATAMGEGVSNAALWGGNSYQHEGICPNGWRVPNKGDWEALVAEVGSGSAGKLKANEIWSKKGTDDYDFAALPSGGWNATTASTMSTAAGASGGTWWWTTTEKNADSAAFARINASDDEVFLDNMNKRARGYSVRCVAYTQEEYTVTVLDYDGKTTFRGDYKPGDQVEIKAGAAPEDGMVFGEWITTSLGVNIDAPNKTTAGFIMPGNDVTVRESWSSSSFVEDERDGKKYRTITVGDRMWMAENLDYNASGSRCYGDIERNCDKYGRLYDWATMMDTDVSWNTTVTPNWDSWDNTDINRQGVCPVGWHLANTAEWDALYAAVGGGTTAVTKLKAKSGWSSNNGTDDIGFSAMPGGYINDYGQFVGSGSQGGWWTSSIDKINKGSRGVVRSMTATGNIINIQQRINGFSVRCVQYLQTTYAVTVNGEGTDATGGGNHDVGTIVTITAGEAPYKKRFKNWTVTSGGAILADATSETTKFMMPGNDATVTANFEQVYFDVVVNAGEGATGGGLVLMGDSVEITAGTHSDGLQFERWTASVNGVSYNIAFADAKSATTKFKMPNRDITVTATFRVPTYMITVDGGGTGATAGGEHLKGETVSIMAGTHPEGLPFIKWTTDNRKVVFEDRYNAATTFTMPDTSATVTAHFGVSFTDGRDGQKYRMVDIGRQRWMGENLNYETGKSETWMADNKNYVNYTQPAEGKCYGNKPENCEKYGKLYRWAAAMGLDERYNTEKWYGSDFKQQGVCPAGWHLPDTADWGELVMATGGPSKVNKTLKVKGWTNGTDSLGFSALPGGTNIINTAQEYFASVGSHGYWHSTTGYAALNNMEHVLHLDDVDSIFGIGSNTWTYAGMYIQRKQELQSVRCVADKYIVAKPAPTTDNLSWTGSEQSPGIPSAPNGEYNVIGDRETDAGEYIATVKLSSDYMWPDGTTEDLTFPWEITPLAGEFVDPVLSVKYFTGLTLAEVTLPAGYAWAKTLDPDPTAIHLYVGDGQKFAAVFTNPDKGHAPASGEITVNVTKASEGLVATAPPVRYIRRDDTAVRDFDLSTIHLNKDDHGELSYSLGEIIDEERILQHAPEIAEGATSLKYQGNGKPSGEARQVIIISSENYEDIAVTVVFEATDTPVYAVTVSGGSADSSGYHEGSTVVVAAYEDGKGKEFKMWTTSDGVTFADADAPQTTFIMPDKAVSVTAVFEDVSYTITYVTGGGAVSPASGETVLGTGKLASLPTPAKTGYEFDGWFTEEAGGARVDAGYAFSASCEIYARWDIRVYAVAWNADGGNPVPAQKSFTYIDGIAAPALMTKFGYTFKGWYVDPSFETAAEFPIRDVTSDTVKLYAKWEINTYGVTWYTNGGIPLLPMVSVVNHGAAVSAPPVAVTKEGYLFDGWYRDPETAVEEVDLPMTVTSDVALYAKWVQVYTVTFDPNGGTVDKTSGVTNANGRLASLPTPARSGYTFEGWYTVSTATGGDRVTATTVFDKNATVYARWNPVLYTVYFNSNHRCVTPSQTSVTVGANGTIPSVPSAPAPIAPCLDGIGRDESRNYVNDVFEGWYMSPAYIPPNGGERVTTSTVFTASATVYAQWTHPDTITFNANGGTVSPAAGATGRGGMLASLPTPARNGYAFDGWYTALTDGIEVTANWTFSGNATIYAQWSPVSVSYTVTFNVNGSGGLVNPTSRVTTGNGTLASLPTPVRSGYAFAGWYTTASSAVGVEVTTATVFEANATIYARWKPVYTVTFNPNGGAVSPTSAKVGIDGLIDGDLPVPARAGYRFDGWFTTSAATGGLEVTEEYEYSANTTIYARWTLVTYTIIFDPNGGAVAVSSGVTGTGGRLASLPTPSSRSGYVFDGWFTESSGGDKVTTSTAFDGDATIYAQWSPIYTITFNPNGGTVTTASAKTVAGGKLASLPTPTRKDYAFAGWYTEEDGGIQVTASTVFDGDAEIYARWSHIYTITFHPNGGAVTTTTAKTTASGKLASLPTPTRSAYTFIGWFTEIDGGDKVTTGTVFEEDAVVYAQWSRLTHARVTFSAGANGTLRAAVDGIPIASGDSVGIGKDVVFTAFPADGYKVSRWTINGSAVVDTSYTYVIAGVSNAATISVSFEPRTSIATPDREIPSGTSGGEVAAIAPVKVLSGVLTVGPNPARVGGDVAIYWTGGKAVSGKLSVFDAVGQKVAAVDVRGTNKIGTWRVGDVAEGTYLIKGVLTDKNGVRVVVSALVGVVR
jgi:uncharacterized protein (TIGR02145 family)/uncharacterized repeat protein (TIGR02543 family)